MAGHEASVPADHGGGLDDQHHVSHPARAERTRQYGQECPVGWDESWSLGLPLEDEDLMAEGQDLCVTVVTGYKEQSETRDQETRHLRQHR
jgi:hypothetical protein